MSFLVVNLGLKSIRAIVFDESGKKRFMSSLPVHTRIEGERVEQDPREWWKKGCAVVRRAVRESGIPVRYLTITSSSACLVPVDKHAHPLGPAVMVSDRRAVEQAEQMERLNAFQILKRKNGFRAHPYFMLPKIMWIKQNDPALYHKTYKFLSSNDYFIARWTQEFVTDTFNAEKFYFDSYERRYPESLFKALHIPLSVLPEPLIPPARVGRLSREAAAAMSLPDSVQVILTTYDAICAFFGTAKLAQGDACDMSGTVTSVRTWSKKIAGRSSGGVFVQPYRRGSIIGISNNLGGGLVEWLKQSFYLTHKNPYQSLTMEAGGAATAADNPVFLPYLLGERAPLWNHSARGVFFGLERWHDRRHMARAVLESTGFITRSLVDAIEENGVPVKRVIVSGGLSRIHLVAQLKSNILGRPVAVAKEVESTSLGAFFLSGAAVGTFEDVFSAARELVELHPWIEPDSKAAKLYSEIYELYRELYENLHRGALFDRRRQLIDKWMAKEKRVTLQNL